MNMMRYALLLLFYSTKLTWSTQYVFRRNYRRHQGQFWSFGATPLQAAVCANVQYVSQEMLQYVKSFISLSIAQSFSAAPEECRACALPMEEGFETLEDLDLEAQGICYDVVDLAIPSPVAVPSTASDRRSAPTVAPPAVGQDIRRTLPSGGRPLAPLPQGNHLSEPSPSVIPPLGPSPLVSRGPSPPIGLSRAPSLPVSRGPSPPVSRGPSPPVGHSPSPPVSRGPSPPVSRGPSPPVSCGPSPPVSRGPSPPIDPVQPLSPIAVPPCAPLAPVISGQNAATLQLEPVAGDNRHNPTQSVPIKRGRVEDSGESTSSKRSRSSASTAVPNAVSASMNKHRQSRGPKEKVPAPAATASSASTNDCTASQAPDPSASTSNEPFKPAANAPKWFVMAMKKLQSQDIDPRFLTLVHTWGAFEVKEGYKEIGKLDAKHRPMEIGDWIQRGRNEKWNAPNLRADKYQLQFTKWWYHLQPDWRRENDTDVAWGSIVGDLTYLRKPGTNGLLSVVAGLFFWGLKVKKGTADWNQFIVCVDDVQAILSALVWPPAPS